MPFKYTDAVKIVDEIAKQGGTISRKDLVNLLRERTNTMQPWWLRLYMQNLVNAELLVLNSDGSFSTPKKSSKNHEKFEKNADFSEKNADFSEKNGDF